MVLSYPELTQHYSRHGIAERAARCLKSDLLTWQNLNTNKNKRTVRRFQGMVPPTIRFEEPFNEICQLYRWEKGKRK